MFVCYIVLVIGFYCMVFMVAPEASGAFLCSVNYFPYRERIVKNLRDMEIITFDQIKAQLRLDDEQAALEHDLLEMYGEAAEETVLDLIRRPLDEVVCKYGNIPARLRQACLMLVDISYKERSPASSQNMSAVPYSFDLLIKPLMRLSE